MSSFTVGATAATFTDTEMTERFPTLLRTWDLELYLASASDYTTLASLLSYPVRVGTCPGSAGATMYVDIGGGAGAGALVLDNVVGSPFNAALVQLDRPSAYPGGGRRARCQFQECPT